MNDEYIWRIYLTTIFVKMFHGPRLHIFQWSFYMYMVHFTFCIFVKIQRLVALFIFHTQDHLWHFRMLLVGEDREGVFLRSSLWNFLWRYKERTEV